MSTHEFLITFLDFCCCEFSSSYLRKTTIFFWLCVFNRVLLTDLLIYEKMNFSCYSSLFKYWKSWYFESILTLFKKHFWNFIQACFLLLHVLNYPKLILLFYFSISEIDYEAADRRYSRTSIQVVNGLPSNRSPRGPMPNVSVK